MHFLLSAAIFFCLLHSNTRADREEVITEEDLKAFEEALAEVQRHGRAESTANSAEPKKGLSSRSKKVNARLLQQGLPKPRKRGRQRSQLRRLLQKAEDSGGADERDIEKAVLQALREETKRPSTSPPTTTPSTTTTPKTTTTTGLSMLKFTPPHRRGETFQRRQNQRVETTTVESTSTVSALEDLIAALELIEPKEFGAEIDRSSMTRITTTPSTTTTSFASTPKITTRKSRPKGASHRITSTDFPIIAATLTPPEDGPIPPTTSSFEEEAHLLSLEIEKNFVETQDEPETIPGPPAIEESTPPAPHPPAPPKLSSGFAPPGAEPPNDLVVEELNTADDFLEVARKLQIFRRRQTRLR